MKPSVKSSLPLAPILFAAVLVLVAIVQARLDNYRLTHSHDQRPFVDQSVFTSDGALVHIGGIPDGGNPGKYKREVFDETMSVKTLSVPSETFSEEYWKRCLSFTSVSEKGVDWWSRQVWADSSLVWWNGPEGQFDGYDVKTRLRADSIGPDGTVARAPARPEGRFRLAETPHFIGEGHDLFLITDDGVLALNADPQNLFLVRLFQGKVDGWTWREEKKSKVLHLWLISGGALWQLDFPGPPVRKIPLSAELMRAMLAASNAVVPLENGGFSIETHEPGTYKETLFLLNNEGRVLRRVEIDRHELSSRIGGFTSKSRTIDMPIIMLPIIMHGPVSMLPIFLLKMTMAAIIQYATLSLVLMGLVMWHQMRTGRRGWRAFAWPVFVLVTGLTGALCYVIAQWDQRTESCPACGKRRPIAQDACPHCDLPWPKPAKSGFEVLETHM